MHAYNSTGTNEKSHADKTSSSTENSTDALASKVDTLTATREEVTTSNAPLESTGSSLTANQSNLNIDIPLSADQLFDFDNATLKPEADAELTKLADQIKKSGNEKVQITGHTDSKGNDAYNEKLSLDRANAVKDWLKNNGIENDIIALGRGEKDPIAENTLANGQDNAEGRAKNRRVDVKYLGTQSISK
ncbi:OmpA family protein [Sphingobacterium sp. UBA6645]|uniref:OmpA family protein n=1 Tax=Sphingobacterium sp. UBA6645 TaxID=1947511 RepID=UPI0025F0EA20|nr:OmpA family protein [Sphingobacterium sp. UBA6645]